MTFPFLRTWKPLLKRARGTAFYADIRELLKLWLFAKRLRRLLDGQNERLYKVAKERDALLVVARWAKLSMTDHKFYVGLADALNALETPKGKRK